METNRSSLVNTSSLILHPVEKSVRSFPLFHMSNNTRIIIGNFVTILIISHSKRINLACLGVGICALYKSRLYT